MTLRTLGLCHRGIVERGTTCGYVQHVHGIHGVHGVHTEYTMDWTTAALRTLQCTIQLSPAAAGHTDSDTRCPPENVVVRVELAVTPRS